MEEEEKTKEMMIVIILGFTALILNTLTIISAGSDIQALSFVKDYIYFFGGLSIFLLIATVVADSKLMPSKYKN